MKKLGVLLIMSLLAIGLIACGGGGEEASGGSSGGGGPVTVDIEGQDILYDVTEIQATANEDITINFTNVGTLEHNFLVIPNNVDPLEAVEADALAGTNAGILQPGESSSVTFSLPAGTYTYVCTVPGHAAAGMLGTLTVN